MKQLTFHTLGSEDAEAILFLHGFLGSHQDWLPIAKIFSKNYFCILVDLPGHGASLSLDDYSFTSVLESIDEFLKGRRLKAIIGYSMGGRIALQYALEKPDTVENLIIESASAGLKTKEERIKRVISDNRWISLLQSTTLDQFLTTWYRQAIFSDIAEDNTLHQELLLSRNRNNNEELMKALLSLGQGQQASLWDSLISLKVKTNLIAGQFDSKYIGIMTEMASLLKNTEIHIIANAKHNVHLAQPSKFVSILDSILKEK